MLAHLPGDLYCSLSDTIGKIPILTCKRLFVLVVCYSGIHNIKVCFPICWALASTRCSATAGLRCGSHEGIDEVIQVILKALKEQAIWYLINSNELTLN